MNDIQMPNTNEIKSQSLVIVQETSSIQIVSHDQYLAAGEHLKKIKAAQKHVREKFADPKKKASDAHKAIVAIEKDLLEPLLNAERQCSSKVNLYMQEQRRIQREKERKEREEAERVARAEEEERRKKQEDERLKTAELLESQGLKEEADEILNEQVSQKPIPITTVVKKTKEEEKPKLEGVHARVSYSAEVTDLMLLIKEIAAGRQPITLIQVNQTVLNQIARALKAELRIPGVQIVEKSSIVAKAAKG